MNAVVKRLAVVFYRYGPYHVARLRAVAKLVDVAGVEFTSRDHVYEWDKVQLPPDVRLKTLFGDHARVGHKIGEIYRTVLDVLLEVQPNVIAIPGWDTGFSLAALSAAHALGIPAVLMSESQRIDFPRYWPKEWVKRRIVGLYSSAIVGGQPHIEYAEELGMERAAIFRCMDAVDNDYFSEAINIRLHLPAGTKKTFLTSARFIPKKNISGLLSAYRMYRDAAGTGAWDLTILGDGPLKGQILDIIRREGLEQCVILRGFVQYPQLPAELAKASAFILPSTSEQWGLVVNEAMAAALPVLVSERAGCARDLVVAGRNGFTFNPFDARELASLMARVASNERDLEQMGQASAAIIAQWGVDYFAQQLFAAAAYAVSHPAPRASTAQRAMLKILARVI